jgi:hypothetical protein
MPRSVEFEAELTGGRTLDLPPEVVAALPSHGKATVVVHVDLDPEDAAWRQAAYERFLADDTEEDSTYDRYC